MTPEERELYERYLEERRKMLPTTTRNEEILTEIIYKADELLRAKPKPKKRRK